MNKRLPRIGPFTVLVVVCAGAGIWCLAEGSLGWAAVSALSAVLWGYLGHSQGA